MMRTKVRTVGISVLGPREGRYVACVVRDVAAGLLLLTLCVVCGSYRYELGIEAIDAVSIDHVSGAAPSEKEEKSPLVDGNGL